ncbi:HD family phosphohydrolase [Seleniivibrio sp.]|uniref:HD family phosphohydrolase n=1 Tax=Seleniivibrio sp. TaxID=2898801 RepID=UPI0025E644FE|nr:HD family phosphohydrolase [Seleniivibrio sp.]MCD8553059.1 GAF domain-containing protein [Seleniivibrio sp.]
MITENGFIELAYSLVRIRDLDELLDTMLGRIRNMLSADAGSIFIYDEDKDELIFSYTQNDSIDLPFKKFRMKANEQSIAGFCAVRNSLIKLDDVYHLDNKFPFKFNQSFDEMSGYRTKSMLVFPINDINGRLIGILQLINKKIKDVPVNNNTVDEAVAAFNAQDETTAHSLSGIVGMALENALLYDSIEAMWEGFIQACMTAIDSRDPVTGGHSERVTTLTMAIAEAMSEDDVFPDFNLNPEQLRSLKYSCMLHDFGKLVISENILQKADKLYPGMMDVIRYRFAMAKAVAKAQGKPKEVLDELDTLLEKVFMANIPTVLDEDTGAGLDKCLNYIFEDIDGNKHQLLTEKEYTYLSIKRGSLTAAERDIIESHVKHTYEFLSKIPWTKELKQVPAVAAMHHEKLNGGGYPFGLHADDIVTQGRIMAIADIYDALTAQDRPYKKAMPVEKACAILLEEAERNVLDIDIVKFFIKNEIYKCLDRRKN